MGRARRPRPKRMGKKLRAIRLQLGLTQQEMCNRLGFKTIQPCAISEYEHGKREPPYLITLRYAQIAGISTDYLIDDRMKLPPIKQ